MRTAAELLRRRLANQRLSRTPFSRPSDAVAWFGAVQAQDYPGGLWALGLRTRGATEAGVEAAEARRAIVRTWPLRGTLHFVAADDARWITRLSAPRIFARNAARWERECGVTPGLLARADDVLTRALEGGRRLARARLYEALEAKRIRTDNSRGLHILMCLALKGRLCLAGRDGRQQTYAVLDDWLPVSRELTGEAALAELARRYFTSHGPASLPDFAWWAGIPRRDALVAIDAAGDALRRERFGDRDIWSGAKSPRPAVMRTPHVALLPAFDEYTVAYKDRSAVAGAGRLGNPMQLLNPLVIIDGRAAGTWRRTLHGDGARLQVRLVRPLTHAERAALEDAGRTYGEYLGTGARITGLRSSR